MDKFASCLRKRGGNIIIFMQPGQIITRKVINHKKFLFRFPQADDVEQLRDYINKLSAEKTFIRLQGKQKTLKEEQEYLNDLLDKIRQNKQLSILAIFESEIVGHVQITMQKHADKHLAEVGITVKKGFRDQGLGTFLMQLAMDQAKQSFIDLEILKLTVFANNDRGIHFYKKLGFCEYGRLPRGIKYKGGYVDRVLMYKNVLS